MIFTRKFFKICVALIVLLTVFNIVYIFTNKTVRENLTSSVFKQSNSLENVDVNEKISWEDMAWIHFERTRVGPGEHGNEYIETNPEMIKKNEEWVKKEGFYVEVSNLISLTRALPDHRPAM